MPNMQKTPVAVLCSDLHLSSQPPACRRHEKDWIASQVAALSEMMQAALRYECPVLCAGDVFDHWSASPSLLNRVQDELGPLAPIYAIPGQHDLPFHRNDMILDSIFWTAHRTGFIRHIPSLEWFKNGYIFISPERGAKKFQIRLWTAAWGEPIPSPTIVDGMYINVLMAHRFVWNGGSTGFTGASDKDKVSSLKALRQYDAAFFGDNHTGFDTMVGKCHVMNCGGFMRRTVKDKNRTPGYGVLYGDGHIERRELRCSRNDVIDDALGSQKAEGADVSLFLEASKQIANAKGLSLASALDRLVSKGGIDPEVEKILREVIHHEQR